MKLNTVFAHIYYCECACRLHCELCNSNVHAVLKPQTFCLQNVQVI